MRFAVTGPLMTAWCIGDLIPYFTIRRCAAGALTITHISLPGG